MTTRTTTAALLLAASTFALTAAPLAAQTATDDGAATATDPLAEGVTTGTDLAQEGAAATVDAETGAGTDVAQDDTQSEIDAETGAGTELAQEGAATVDAETGAGTDVAQDDTQSEIDAETGAGTDLAQEGTATENATGTDVAADDAATGAATGAATDGTALAQDESATGDTGAEVTTEEAIAAGDGAATDIEGTQDTQTAAGDVPSEPTEPMAAVLEKHAELGARPIEELSVEEARTQPTPADAVMALMQEQGIEMPAELAAIATRDVTYPGADGSEQQARVYTPEGEGPFPLILYFHGGGWVIADIDTYDASARALAAGANAVVVSAHYRQGPENPFPAAHDDANAAFVHFVETSGEINADTERLAVAGESAGGNLAFNVAAYARDNQLTPIDHMLLVYPVAGDDMETASYQTNAEARPLSRAGMMWFVEHAFEDPSQTSDPRIDIVGRDDFADLPPATIINAEIDPLTTEGVTLGSLLEEAGVEVSQMTYPSVTHEFFGMGAVVPEAQEAVDMATANLRAAFGEEGVAEGVSDDVPTADAGVDATGDAAADATTEAADAEAGVGTVEEVEPTAAETPEATAGEAAEGEDAMQMDDTAEPIEGETATQGD